jgi:hypothetical protein
MASLHQLVSALTPATESLFHAPQGDVTFSLAESDTEGAQLRVRWSGAAAASSSLQPSAADQLSESPALILQNYLDSIESHRREFEFQKAIETARDLEDWMERHELSVPPGERCDAYVTLAEVERIRLAVAENEEERTDDRRCRVFVEKAKQVQI